MLNQAVQEGVPAGWRPPRRLAEAGTLLLVGGAAAAATWEVETPACLGTGAAANAPRRPRGNIIARQKVNYEICKQ